MAVERTDPMGGLEGPPNPPRGGSEAARETRAAPRGTVVRPELEGVFVPVPTPFRGDEVAPGRLIENLRRWNQTALAGYVVLGSTGEFPLLSESERDRVLVAAREGIIGSAAALLPSLAIGSSGGILALASIAAREFSQIHALARGGRWDEARPLAARMMTADRGIPGRYGIGGLKAALDLQGFYGGPCRSPLATPDGNAIEDIKEVLATAELL